MLAKLRVDVITIGAGSPGKYIEQWKEAGAKVVPVVASSALAARMQRCGADAVIAEGTEAGGHIGELSTMALVPQVCDTVTIPVIAAGGIADGRGVAAAFALGAEGVQVGTRFLTVEECCIAEAYKAKVLAAKDSDTIVPRGGHPVRCLKNAWSRNVRSSKTRRLRPTSSKGCMRARCAAPSRGMSMAGRLWPDRRPAWSMSVEARAMWWKS
ncbi:MAG: DUF561 domain-containing protein [Eggerthellaceae bacterium]